MEKLLIHLNYLIFFFNNLEAFNAGYVGFGAIFRSEAKDRLLKRQDIGKSFAVLLLL